MCRLSNSLSAQATCFNSLNGALGLAAIDLGRLHGRQTICKQALSLCLAVASVQPFHTQMCLQVQLCRSFHAFGCKQHPQQGYARLSNMYRPGGLLHMLTGSPGGLCNVVFSGALHSMLVKQLNHLQSSIVVLLCWYESNSCMLQAKQAQLVSSR